MCLLLEGNLYTHWHRRLTLQTDNVLLSLSLATFYIKSKSVLVTV